jgi:motility quorum-sensing regulator/GCU-specific mRNA interferase toxin
MHATYDLNHIKELIKTDAYFITQSALDGAMDLNFDITDILAVISTLRDTDFYKTMESEKKMGYYQDVYRPTYQGIDLYVKIQISGKAVVISFKRK